MGLDDLNESDFFNMIEFNGDVRHWSREGFTGSKTEEFYPATEENKNKAITSVLELAAGGGTNLNEAILAGLEVAETALQREALPRDVKSLVVFLTDGLGSTPGEVIKSNIKTKNRDLQTPVFTVAFGADTDLSLLQSIASQNNAVSQRIYEGSDAALQLEDFYAQISSPVLSNLKFEYVGGLDNSSVSETELNTFFRGGELIVSGKLSTLDDEPPSFGVKISGLGKAGLPYHRELDICPRTSTTDPHPAPQCLQPRVYPKSEAQSFLQKLFAFQHIRQVLKKRDLEQIEEEKQKLTTTALELSLKNNFVTDLTSLVVIKPDETPKVNKFVDNSGFQNRHSVQYSSTRTASFSPGSFGIQPLSLSFASPPRPAPPIQAVSVDYDIAYDAYDDSFLESSNAGRPRQPPTTEAPVECNNGTLSLYSKTYNRGQMMEVTESVADLSTENFDKKAVSALLTGDCCWEIYAAVNYTGEFITLNPYEKYSSVTSLGNLFRDVESVKKAIFVC